MTNEEKPTGNIHIGDSAAIEGDVFTGGKHVHHHYQRPPLGTPFLAPPLPPHFVPRPEVTDAVKVRLLADHPPTGILVISAIHGLGGIGKSTVATALAYDPEVQQRFKDGILWATLGQQPDLLSLLGGWIQALGDYRFRPITVEATSAHLRNLLQNKATLLVVDDVWEPSHALPFRIGGYQGHVLITTRRADVAEEVDADLYEMDVMSPEQSLVLLSARLGRVLSESERKEALQLAKVVGYLPLALELAAARVTRGISWEILCEALEEEIARLEALESPRHRRQRYTRLEATFNLSLNALRTYDEKAWRAFIWLGILPEDVQIAAPMTSTLWNIDKVEAADILELLWNDALLLLTPPIFIGECQWSGYRLHDLLHDIARRLLTSSQQGLGVDLSAAHATLLRHYQSHTQNGLWHTLPPDGYIHTYLTWHLEQAEWEDTLHTLLREKTIDGRNGWYEVCNRLDQTAKYLADVTRAWRLAEDAFKTSLATQEPPEVAQGNEVIGLQCCYALIMASFSSISENISPELITALVESKIWSPVQGLAYARQRPQEKLRAKALAELAPHLSNLPTELLREVLEAVQTIRNGVWRAETLVALAPSLPKNLREEMLVMIRNSMRKRVQGIALTGLIPYLPEPLKTDVFQEALDIAQAIHNDIDRTRILVRLTPYLPEPECMHVLRGVLTLVQETQVIKEKEDLLVELAPYLTKEELLREALTAVLSVSKEKQREILLILAPHLSKGLIQEAMAATRKLEMRDSFNRSPQTEVMVALAMNPWVPNWEMIKLEVLNAVRTLPLQDWLDGSPRAEMLIRLAISLPNAEQKQVLREALEAARAIQDEQRKVKVLAELILYLSASERNRVLREAIMTTRAIKNKYSRAEALMRLFPYLPDSQGRQLVSEIFTEIQSLEDEDWRGRALLGLVPYLPETLLRTLPIALINVKDRDSQAKVLATLAPHMFADKISDPIDPLLQEAMLTTLEHEWKGILAQVLMKMAPRIAEMDYPREALVTARVIRDEEDRTKALSVLASRLRELGYLQEAWEAIRAIRDQHARAISIAQLAPYLSERLQRDALAKASKFDNVYDRAIVMAGIIPYLTEPLKHQTEKELLGVVVRKIQNEGDMIDILTRVVPHLSDALLREVLAIVTLTSNKNRVVGLTKIIPYLPDPLKEQTIEKEFALIQSIRNEEEKVALLTKFAPYMSQNLQQYTLATVRALSDEPTRMITLTKLVPYLSEPLKNNIFQEVLEMTQEVESELPRVEVLIELFSCLPDALKEEFLRRTLRVARTIESDSARLEVLIGFAPHLSQLPRETLFVLWSELLHDLALHSRQELLVGIQVLAPVIFTLGGSEAITETFLAIHDVGQWWP